MSKRREIERPAELTLSPLVEAVTYEDAAEEHRKRVLSSPRVREASPQLPRHNDLDRASYQVGSTVQGRRQLGAVSAEERYAVAMEFVPLHPIVDVVRVRAQAVESVMPVPYVSLALDADLLSRMYGFGIWHYRRFGSFAWRTDLTEQKINDYVATSSGVSQSTVNTYKSQLMRVMRGDKTAVSLGKKTKALMPHPSAEFEQLWGSANSVGRWTADATTHLALSGGAGLRPNEINYIRGSWVNESKHGTYVRIPNNKGEFRDVPVAGRYAEVIRRAASNGSHSYLVMPQLVSRRNLLSHLKEMVKPLRSDFAAYDTIRARNLWLSRMLAAAVPTVVVAQVAGVGAGSSLLADLAADLPERDLGRVFEYLTQAELTD